MFSDTSTSDFVTRQEMYYLVIDDGMAAGPYEIQMEFPTECNIVWAQAITLTSVDPASPVVATATTSQSLGVFNAVLTEVSGLVPGALIVDGYGYQGNMDVDPREPGQISRIEHIGVGSLVSSTRVTATEASAMGWVDVAGDDWLRGVHTIVVYQPRAP